MPSGHPTSARQRGMSASSAVTFVRRLNGASQPIIVLATGCKFYIAKFLDFTGRYGLLGEAVGAGIMRAMGLPTPEWVPLRFTDEFLDAHPEVWYQNTHGTSGIRPGAGLHFASRLVVSADGSEPYQIIPSKWVSRILNRRDFVGALLADLWMNNCDLRQAVYVAQGSPERLRAVFIDNDNILGGYRGDEKTTPRRAMAPLAGLYEDICTKEILTFWKRRLDRVDEDCLDAIFAAVPEEWADSDAIQWARSELRSRRRLLDHLIAEAAANLGKGNFVTFSRPRSAIEERICGPVRREPRKATSSDRLVASTMA